MFLVIKTETVVGLQEINMNEFCVKIPDFVKDFIRNNDGMCLGINFTNTAPSKEEIEKNFILVTDV